MLLGNDFCFELQLFWIQLKLLIILYYYNIVLVVVDSFGLSKSPGVLRGMDTRPATNPALKSVFPLSQLGPCAPVSCLQTSVLILTGSATVWYGRTGG